jgi:hypothetical protein
MGAIAALLGGAAAATAEINLVAITQWLPVTDEERNLKAPTIDPEAGAEALFWRVHVVDSFESGEPRRTYYNYLRIKIFSQRGCETQGTQDIEYLGQHEITNVAGRTIKPDGAIVELKKDAIFRRDIVKSGGVKVKAVSFAMPAVEPGVIIEYHWREVRYKELAEYVRMPFQREIPVHEVKYYVRPLSLSDVRLPMRLVSFGVKTSNLVNEKDGFSSITQRNMPAFKEEPLMPSEWIEKAWTLVYYADDPKPSAEKFWAGEGKKIYALNEPYLKVNGDVRNATEAALAGATNPDDQLLRLMRYCRSRIKGLSDQDVTERQREKAKENNKPADTLKRGIGTGFDVNMLFAAMARAAGFDVRVARLGDRSDRPFDPNLQDTVFLRTFDIAVKVGDQWRFYDAAAKWLPPGMLSWGEEGSRALISDPKDPVFVQVPFSDGGKSVTTRTGDFRLSEDGTLEGEVRLEYTGHAAAYRREEKAKEAAAQREDDVKDSVRARFSNAEVSAVKVENIEDTDKPLTYSYHVKVPGYAQRTGKRLFVQVGYFENGQAARFPASERKHPVWFEYAWSDHDHITYKTPPGFSLERGEAPSPLMLGDLGGYEVSIQAGKDLLIYDRALTFGRGGRLMFPVSVYSQLKGAFDAIHERDQHTLTLRQMAAGAGAGQ